FAGRRRHTRFSRDWSSDVCSSDLADGGRRRIDVVAVAVELALAEVAAAAEDVEGYEDMVALLEPADGRTDLLDDAGELVTERGADAGVRHEPMVEMKVGAADAGARHAHDRIVRMLDRGLAPVV